MFVLKRKVSMWRLNSFKMYKLCCCLLLATFATGVFSLSDEDDKKNVLLIFSTSPTSAQVTLNETNTNLIDKAKKTVFLIHGWMESQNDTFYSTMFKEYDKKGGYNVIRVDWSAYSQSSYVNASRVYLSRIGDFLGKYINTLRLNGVQLSKIHLIGHSLGSHVAGIAGKKIKSLSGPIARISGLDPAGPLFHNFNSPSNRLGPTDANMVDCLYTNSGVFGSDEVLGTHNFYANNAFIQPGCELEIFLCSHERSPTLYSESINSNRFVAVEVASFNFIPFGTNNSVKVIYGENTNATPGSYYFRTSSTPPYALG